MPELPEVETTLRGLQPHLTGRCIESVLVRESRLRWPFLAEWVPLLEGATVLHLQRRAKYLLVGLDCGHILIHLGMSGSLRLVEPKATLRKHDHIIITLSDTMRLCYHDPRRFGCVLLLRSEPAEHPLLRDLGPEPLSACFTPEYLYSVSRSRRAPVKAFLMDQSVVTGVGNIYATEALFDAGIHPARAAGRVSLKRYTMLVSAVRATLTRAIASGGTTLRDFVNSAGEPGYFRQTLRIYGRAGADCLSCGTALRLTRIAQRATVYCPRCQR